MKETELASVCSASTELFIANHILVTLVPSPITNSLGNDHHFIQTLITCKHLLNILCQQF